MKWNKMQEESAIEAIVAESHTKPVIIYKHSTRCSTSAMVLGRLERSWKEEEMEDVSIHYLDVIAQRDISNRVMEVFHILHESPQILVIYKGECVYESSHTAISYAEIKKQIDTFSVRS